MIDKSWQAKQRFKILVSMAHKTPTLLLLELLELLELHVLIVLHYHLRSYLRTMTSH